MIETIEHVWVENLDEIIECDDAVSDWNTADAVYIQMPMPKPVSSLMKRPVPMIDTEENHADDRVACHLERYETKRRLNAMHLAMSWVKRVAKLAIVRGGMAIRAFVNTLIGLSAKEEVYSLVENFGMSATVFGSEDWHRGKTVLQIKRKARLALVA